jgi:hypothetical protein
MNCPVCNNPNHSDFAFCTSCGAVVDEQKTFVRENTFSQAKTVPINSAEMSPAKYSINPILVFILLVLAVPGFFAARFYINEYQYNNAVIERNKSSSNPTTQKTTQQPRVSQPAQTPRAASQEILNQTFGVGAGQWKSFGWKFEKPSHLTGTYSAIGGNNDISCIIVDAENFRYFQNGKAAQTVYNPGYISLPGTVDLRLAPGSYYIIFDNRIALITNKTVTAIFEVEN